MAYPYQDLKKSEWEGTGEARQRRLPRAWLEPLSWTRCTTVTLLWPTSCAAFLFLVLSWLMLGHVDCHLCRSLDLTWFLFSAVLPRVLQGKSVFISKESFRFGSTFMLYFNRGILIPLKLVGCESKQILQENPPLHFSSTRIGCWFNYNSEPELGALVCLALARQVSRGLFRCWWGWLWWWW